MNQFERRARNLLKTESYSSSSNSPSSDARATRKSTPLSFKGRGEEKLTIRRSGSRAKNPYAQNIQQKNQKQRPRSISKGSPLSRNSNGTNSVKLNAAAMNSKKSIWQREKVEIMNRLLEMEVEMEKQKKRMKELQGQKRSKGDKDELERLKDSEIKLIQELQTQQLVAREALERLLKEQDNSEQIERENNEEREILLDKFDDLTQRYEKQKEELMKAQSIYKEQYDKNATLQENYNKLQENYREQQDANRKLSDSHRKLLIQSEQEQFKVLEELKKREYEIERLKRVVRERQLFAESEGEVERYKKSIVKSQLIQNEDEQINSLKQQLSERDTIIKEKEDAFRDQLAKINHKVRDWQQDLDKLRELEFDNNKIKQDFIQLQEQYSQLYSQYDEISDKYQQSQDKYEELKYNLEQSKQELIKQNHKHKDRKRQWTDLYKELVNQIETLKIEVDHFKQDNTHLSSYSPFTPSNPHVNYSHYNGANNNSYLNSSQLPYQNRNSSLLSQGHNSPL